MVPKDDSLAFMAAGNTATCEAQGFISVVAFITLEFSYTILSVLYWIIVARGWTEKNIQRGRIRFFFLGLPIIVGIGFATPTLFYDMYNFTGVYSCFIEEYPLHCDINGVECTRGANAGVWQGVLFTGVLVCTLVILVFMTLLVRAVRAQEGKTDRYLTAGQQKHRKMTKKAFWQAIRYISVFVISNLPFYVVAFFDLSKAKSPRPIIFVYAIVWPMFGVFNAIAYFRPKYVSYRERNQELSWIVCLCNILNTPSLGAWMSSGPSLNESVPPNVADLLEDGDLGSPLFQDECL